MRKKKECAPKVAMLSNNKTRLLASDLGHIALYDGLRTVFYSDFSLFSLGKGSRFYAVCDGEKLPLYPLGKRNRRFSSDFFFECDAERIRYISYHRGRGKSIELSLIISISPSREMMRAEITAFGDVKALCASFSGMPVLDTRARGGKDIKIKYREREDVLIFSKEGDNDFFLGTKERGGIMHRVFDLVLSDDEEDAVHMLTERGCDGGLLRLYRRQLGFSGLAHEYASLESHLLSDFIIKNKKSLRQKNARIFSRYYISEDSDILLLDAKRFSFFERENLEIFISLFKYMCIRGGRFTMVIFCGEREIAERICGAVTTFGCADFLGRDNGILVLDGTQLNESELREFRAFAAAEIDISKPLCREAERTSNKIMQI